MSVSESQECPGAVFRGHRSVPEPVSESGGRSSGNNGALGTPRCQAAGVYRLDGSSRSPIPPPDTGPDWPQIGCGQTQRHRGRNPATMAVSHNIYPS